MSISRRSVLKAGAFGTVAAATSVPSAYAKTTVHNAGNKSVVIVVANEILHPTLGWPLGFWIAELTHPYAELAAHGYSVTIASLLGGKVTIDAYSDPRHESEYAASDFISLGFLESPKFSPLLNQTSALADIDASKHDAIIVAGGQAPMFTFRGNDELERLIRQFYDANKPTAALCHGVSALIDLKIDDGSYLVAGKTITGFSAAEDAYVDEALGTKLFDWWIEPAAKERGANFTAKGMWANYAVADGNLITGQQQFSGSSVARLVLEQLSS